MTTAHGEEQVLTRRSTTSDTGLKSLPGGHPRRDLRQLLTAGLFWTLCLTLTAAGHRLYKTVVAADRQVSIDRYQTDGAPVVWVGQGTMEDAYVRHPDAGSNVTDVQLHALPNSAFWLAAMVGFTALAGFMAWCGQYVDDNGIQSLVGLYAGHFLWLGAVEFGLDAVGRRLGLCGSLESVNGRIVGTHGSGILIQMSAVFLVPVLIAWAIHESNRCALVQWFRSHLPLTRAVAASGRVDNYAARTTMQYFLTVWFCYVAVLWLADPIWGRARTMSLLVVMGAIFVATPWMIWRTTRQTGTGQSLRYSISGAVVTWTGIEIAASMRMFDEPWLSNSVFSGVLFIGLTALLTAMAVLLLVTPSPGARLTRTLSSMAVAVALFGQGGCGDVAENQAAANPEEIVARLREFNDRTIVPVAASRDGLLHALTSDSPQTAAQAAIAFGKSGHVSPIVEQQLRALAVSRRSPLSQFAALQALFRLELLTPESQSVIDELASDENWAAVAEYIRH